MPAGLPSISAFPSPAELGWYLFLRRLEGWSNRLSEADVIERTVRLSSHLAGLAGRPVGPFVAMARGLAVTVLFRSRRISIMDRLDEPARRKLESFRRSASAVPRAVFASAHLGPFQLQMDLLACLPHEILILYRSYHWRPLADRLDDLRQQFARFRYVDIRRTRDIVQSLNNSHSLAVMGDVGDIDFPVRIALRKNWPIFVGGLFHRPQPDISTPAKFGFDYMRIDPVDPLSMRRAFSNAMEQTIRNNPADWVQLE